MLENEKLKTDGAIPRASSLTLASSIKNDWSHHSSTTPHRSSSTEHSKKEIQVATFLAEGALSYHSTKLL